MSLSTIPRPLRQILKKIAQVGPLHRLYLSALKRRQIAVLMHQGVFAQPPPGAEESRRLVSEWDQQGRPAPPPPAYKQGVVKEYGRRFDLQTLVETGTYMGDAVAAGKDQFRRIYSIELSADLARLAKKRFRHDAHITILQGDSETVLPGILSGIQEPCLFWLDGHYSGGITALGKSVTPILGELQTIFAHPVKDHVLLIDDARDFRHEKNHPTLAELREFVAARRPDLSFEVEDDIIRLHRPPVQPSIQPSIQP